MKKCGVYKLTCALAGAAGRPRFPQFLVRAMAFITVVVRNAGPTWSLLTCQEVPRKTFRKILLRAEKSHHQIYLMLAPIQYLDFNIIKKGTHF